MQFSARDQVTLMPNGCFGRRGPLYLVACAVNISTHHGDFMLTEGQEVAPPPFNDRCIAISGRCAYSCMEQQTPALKHCDAAGQIPEADLTDNFELPTNQTLEVHLFIWTLLFGFAVKLLTYVPGLFIPYTHSTEYSVEQTAQLKYIAVCAPSGGETKACVLRNMVGAISSLPTGCLCPFHVIFADEGHRHPLKIMFRAFAEVLKCVPDHSMSADRNKCRPLKGCKE